MPRYFNQESGTDGQIIYICCLLFEVLIRYEDHLEGINKVRDAIYSFGKDFIEHKKDGYRIR